MIIKKKGPLRALRFLKRVCCQASSVTWIEVIFQACGLRAIADPRSVESAVVIRFVVTTSSSTAMKLTNHTVLIIEEWRSRRSWLSCSNVPVSYAHVSAVPW